MISSSVGAPILDSNIYYLPNYLYNIHIGENKIIEKNWRWKYALFPVESVNRTWSTEEWNSIKLNVFFIVAPFYECLKNVILTGAISCENVR